MQLIRPHIALLPLAEHRFNESKSAIKWFEMTMAGAACVASNVGPYAEHVDDTDGYIAYQQEWLLILKWLIEYPDARRRLWNNSMATIENEHSWQGHNKSLWLDWFRQVVA
jgi:hypothetical protein